MQVIPMTDTMRLVLLRHGESVWNKENLFTGWTDVDLSDKGREEARAAGRLMRDEGPSTHSTSRWRRWTGSGSLWSRHGS